MYSAPTGFDGPELHAKTFGRVIVVCELTESQQRQFWMALCNQKRLDTILKNSSFRPCRVCSSSRIRTGNLRHLFRSTIRSHQQDFAKASFHLVDLTGDPSAVISATTLHNIGALNLTCRLRNCCFSSVKKRPFEYSKSSLSVNVRLVSRGQNIS